MFQRLCWSQAQSAGVGSRGVLRQRARTAGWRATLRDAGRQQNNVVETGPCAWPCSSPTFRRISGPSSGFRACVGVYGLDVIEPCGFPVDDKRIRRAAMDYYDLARASPATPRGRPSSAPAANAGRPAGPADDQGRRCLPRRRLPPRTTSCCSAARAPACRTRCTRPPTCRLRVPLQRWRALAQCRAGRRHGSERGPAPDLQDLMRSPTKNPTPLPDATIVQQRKRTGARLVREPARSHLRRRSRRSRTI